MSEFKGFKGPFRVGRYPTGAPIIVAACHRTVAIVFGGKECVDANAHLFAASWDLLEAAQKALERSCGCNSNTSDDWHAKTCAVPQLRAAIAKALNQQLMP